MSNCKQTFSYLNRKLAAVVSCSTVTEPSLKSVSLSCPISKGSSSECITVPSRKIRRFRCGTIISEVMALRIRSKSPLNKSSGQKSYICSKASEQHFSTCKTASNDQIEDLFEKKTMNTP